MTAHIINYVIPLNMAPISFVHNIIGVELICVINICPQ